MKKFSLIIFVFLLGFTTFVNFCSKQIIYAEDEQEDNQIVNVYVYENYNGDIVDDNCTDKEGVYIYSTKRVSDQEVLKMVKELESQQNKAEQTVKNIENMFQNFYNLFNH